MTEEAKQAPIQTLRDGPVVAKLWQQTGQNGPYVSVTLGRTYQDPQSGEYRESRSLAGADVLKGHALLLEAHREIGKWREYFKEQQKSQAPQSELPIPEGQAQAAPQQQNGFAEERDKVMAAAAPATPAAAPTAAPAPGQLPDM